MNSDCNLERHKLTAVRPIPFAWWLCAALGIIALCFAARFALEYRLAWHCPVMTLFRIPCPSCGSTRALAALSNLQLGAALRFNPLFVSSILLGPVAFVFRERFTPYARFGWFALTAAVLANWVYLLVFLPR